MLALVCAFSFVSCGGDDDNGPDVSGKKDYYINVSVTCPGWDRNDVDEFETELRREFLGMELKGYRFEDAKEVFDELVDDLQYEFDDYYVEGGGPLTMTFELKLSESGDVVSTRTVVVEAEK